LLNILIALYNSAYEDISGNAIDEYMAIFALKTMQFVRAPDENVFIPPFNLLEIIFLVFPLEWWLPSHYYAKINDVVMTIIYSPLLLIVAFIETREARRIRWNRGRGEEDDDDVQEWEHVVEEVDFDLDDAWRESVRESTPNVDVDRACLEIIQLQEQVRELTEAVKQLSDEKNESSFSANGESSAAPADNQ
ncbi:Calcium channel yvc1, partial [Elasticomyces elasticus]